MVYSAAEPREEPDTGNYPERLEFEVNVAAIKANWRITFRFHDGAAYDVDLEDYH